MTVQDNTHITENADLQDKAFLPALPMWLQNLKKNFWPSSPDEKVKFLFLSALLFLMSMASELLSSLNASIFQTFLQTKLININPGADVSIIFSISFLLLYGLFVYKLRPRNIFYVMMGAFLSILSLSGIVMYGTVYWLEQINYLNFWGKIFYTFANFWNTGLVGIVLISMLHQLYSWEQAKRVYVPFFIVGSMGYLAANVITNLLITYNLSNYLFSRLWVIVFLGLGSVYVYKLLLKRMDQEQELDTSNEDLVSNFSPQLSELKKKQFLWLHPRNNDLKIRSYIGVIFLIILLLVCYVSSFNILETQWKNQLSLFTAGNKSEYNHFMGKKLIYDSLFSILFLLGIGLTAFRAVKWHKLVALNFVILFAAATVFFAFLILSTPNKSYTLFAYNLKSSVVIGLAMITLIKACAVTFIFVGLPMLFTLLNYGGKTIGLSIFEIFGRSVAIGSGPVLQSFLLTFNNNTMDLPAVAPSSYVVVMFLCFIGFLTAFVLKYRLRFN